MLTVLVVEDDKYLSSAYRVKLSKAELNVKTVANGEEALAYLQSSLPDLIILDLVMPHEDGFAVLKEIKSRDQLKGIPVIIASNLGQPEDVSKAMQLGAVDYVVKSQLTMDQLVDRIMAAIKKESPSAASTSKTNP